MTSSKSTRLQHASFPVRPNVLRSSVAALALCASCSALRAESTTTLASSHLIAPATQEATAPLAFTLTEGNIANHFFRQGPVAAHLLVSSGPSPRLIFAFPAGNTGLGLWFADVDPATRFFLAPGSSIAPVQQADGLRGISAQLQSTAKTLVIKSSVLANIRNLREYIAEGFKPLPENLRPQTDLGASLRLYRTTIDGQHHLELRVLPTGDTTLASTDQGIALRTGPSGQLAFTITALADDAPLTPFSPGQIFNANVAPRPTDQQVFAFLASKEKFDAGSWRFLTYFGRDTLLSLELLMPVLKPAVIEGALGSVIERLSPHGEVAHEESIGEYAVIENQRATPPPKNLLAPVYDYKMIDGEYLLALAASSYLLDHPESTQHAKAFLARTTPSGETYGAALQKNLALILDRAASFAAHPERKNLVSLKPGQIVGNWRDSEVGLGGGLYPYDVNAVLMPTGLQAAARLYRSGLLGQTDALAQKAEHAAEAWKAAEAFFALTLPAKDAQQQVAAYAASLKLDATAAVASIDQPVHYHALALRADGSPVPVMHTDSGFALFFGQPSADYLDAAARQILRPFPAGLRTPVGLVVANPVFANATTQALFTRDHYHGTVVWSWQQALMAAGLKRQLQRTDLPTTTKALLTTAEDTLWSVIANVSHQSAGELWTWEPKDGAATLAPFGQGKGHMDESNAAQLWSTVYLSVQPPIR